MTTTGALAMEQQATWTVGQVADLLGITVRTLHHYDEIGLVRPSGRSAAGYRLYTEADLTRLQQVVVYRRLEMPLEQIGALLGEEGDAVSHLMRQRSVVLTRLGELHELAAALDRAIDGALEREMNDRPATPEDLKELFGDGFSDEYAQEAEQRWGETDAWKQSAARTKRYTTAEWEQVRAEMEAVHAAFVRALRAGEPATSEAAMDAAEAHRRHIHERFYDLDHTFHRALADMYVADPRFTKTYEDLEEGLAQYVRDAVHANADRHSS